VDILLQSPRYGERYGPRRWLDSLTPTPTPTFRKNRESPDLALTRDWVIRAGSHKPNTGIAFRINTSRSHGNLRTLADMLPGARWTQTQHVATRISIRNNEMLNEERRPHRIRR